MIALAGLLLLVTILLVVSRIGSVALEATGMARDSAEFQARSALLGVGFTTSEAEEITSHPVRRKIVLYLMTVGNASVIAGIASFLLAFLDAETQQTVRRSGILMIGVVAIIAAFHTGLAKRVIERSTHAMLARYTTIDIRDYAALLRVENDYAITELQDDDYVVAYGRLEVLQELANRPATTGIRSTIRSPLNTNESRPMNSHRQVNGQRSRTI